jgi:hypothetical protein
VSPASISAAVGRRLQQLRLNLAKGLRTPVAELLGGVRDIGPEALEAAHLFEGAAPDVQDAVLRLLRAVSRRRR